MATFPRTRLNPFGRHAWGAAPWGPSPFDEEVAPEPAPAPAGGAALGVGRGAWRNYYRSTLPKKKRTLLDELDEMIVELEERIADAPPTISEEVFERTLRVSQNLANLQSGSVSVAAIERQIDIVKRAIEDIDDEEIILLAIH